MFYSNLNDGIVVLGGGTGNPHASMVKSFPVFRGMKKV